jgi:hypothetical protein
LAAPFDASRRLIVARHAMFRAPSASAGPSRQE